MSVLVSNAYRLRPPRNVIKRQSLCKTEKSKEVFPFTSDLIFLQMSQKGDSENDIWDYKPLGKKKKRREPPSVSATVLKRRCLSGKGSKKSKSAKSIDDRVDTAKHEYFPTDDDVTGGEGSSNNSRRMENPEFPLRSSLIEDTDESHSAYSEDFCPMCQMPFSILVVQTHRWHVAECLEFSRDSCAGN